QDEVDVEAAAADIEARDIAHEDAEVAELAELLAHLLHHVALGVVAAERGHGIAVDDPAPEPSEAERTPLVRRGPHVHVPLADAREEAAARGDEDGLHAGH